MSELPQSPAKCRICDKNRNAPDAVSSLVPTVKPPEPISVFQSLLAKAGKSVITERMCGRMDGRKLKLLYVLALFQLVAGPLVLFQVILFCKLTVRESPRQGIATAFCKAWNSNEFQASIQEVDGIRKENANSPLPTSDPGERLIKAKIPWIIWKVAPLRIIAAIELVPCSDWAQMWTPTWPQAPPAPPPRVG